MSFYPYAAYNISTVYPSDWRVELNPKSDNFEGDVVFHSPKGDKIYISWGKLEKAKERFEDLEEHTKVSIERLRKTRDVVNMNVLDKRDGSIYGHRAILSQIEISTAIPTFSLFGSKRTDKRLVLSAHFYCEQSERYVVLYSLSRESEENIEPLFREVAQNLKCH